MKTATYDIESTETAFTVAVWMPEGVSSAIANDNLGVGDNNEILSGAIPTDPHRERPTLDVYYLFDAPMTMPSQDIVKTRVALRNPRLITDDDGRPTEFDPKTDIRLFDLHDSLSVLRLASLMGYDFVDADKPISAVAESDGAIRGTMPSDFPTDVTDGASDQDYCMLGYNSYNYDTTMLAIYLGRVADTNRVDAWEVETLEAELAGIESKMRTVNRNLTPYRIQNLMTSKEAVELQQELNACIERRDKIPGEIESLRAKRLDTIQRFTQEAKNQTGRDCKARPIIIEPDAITARELREYNDKLFSKEFVKSMSMYLRYINTDCDTVAARFGAKRGKKNRQGTENYQSTAFKLRQCWLRSGRHIDIGRLNEKQRRVALKRQLGVLGRQIFEDPSVVTGETQDVADLIAYNCSDVIGSHFLFLDDNYQAPLANKQMILDTYPETVFTVTAEDLPAVARHEKQVARDPSNIRKTRLKVDSTSQQIISTVLCPNPESRFPDHATIGHALIYPDASVARDVAPRDVLEETSTYFYETVLPTVLPEWQPLAVYQWERARQHYRWLAERNVNSSEFFNPIEGKPVTGPGSITSQMPGLGTCLIYFGQDGRPTSCYAIVSEGGIHGAEFDADAYRRDIEAYKDAVTVQRRLIELFDPENHDPDTAARNILVEGVRVISRDFIKDPSTGEPFEYKGRHFLAKHVLTSGSTRKRARFKSFSRPQLFKPKPMTATKKTNLTAPVAQGGIGFPAKLSLATAKSQLIKHKFSETEAKRIVDEIIDSPDMPLEFISDGLNSRYAKTSAAEVNHDDFASYYPNLLRRMAAFYNPELGYDRYGELYDQKQTFGIYQKHPDEAPEAERAHIAQLSAAEQGRHWKRRRDGVKLMLNAGSGAGDATFDNAIRKNNTVTAMRMIGQLFTWRIGQAQSLEGGLVPSTNTDGLYTVMDEKRSDDVLARESATIEVDIEPERMNLVSKDSNNRVEYAVPTPDRPIWKPNPTTVADFDEHAVRIFAAGGSLSCWRGPSTAKSIDHPALYDRIMAYYLIAEKELGEALNLGPEHMLAEPFDRELAREIIRRYVNEALAAEPAHRPDRLRQALSLFQTMVVSSPSSYSFVMCRPIAANGTYESDWRSMQHYNRVFFVRPDADLTSVPTAVRATIMRASARIVDKSKASTEAQTDDPTAVDELARQGVSLAQIEEEGRVAKMVKVNGINPEQVCAIVNGDLYLMAASTEAETLIRALDIEAYLDRIEEIYEDNWRNGSQKPPAWLPAAFGDAMPEEA